MDCPKTLFPRRHFLVSGADLNPSSSSSHILILSSNCTFIGVDLAGLLGGRMASAEGGSMSSGVAYGEGCPLSSRLTCLRSVVSSPSGVRGGAPAENAILAYFEGHRTLIFVPI